MTNVFEQIDESVVGGIDIVQQMRPLGVNEHMPLVRFTRHGPWLDHAVEHTKGHLHHWEPSYGMSVRNYALQPTTTPTVPLVVPFFTPRTPGSWAKKPGWSPRQGAFGESSSLSASSTPRGDMSGVRTRAPAFTDGLQRAAAMSPPKPMSLPPLAPPQPMEVPYEVKPHFSSLQMQLAQRPTRHAHWRPEKKKK